jgi:hypothetical protein
MSVALPSASSVRLLKLLRNDGPICDLKFERGEQFPVMHDHEIPLLLLAKPAGQLNLPVNRNTSFRDFRGDQQLAHQSDETVHLLAAGHRTPSAPVPVPVSLPDGLLLPRFPEMPHSCTGQKDARETR